MNPADLKTVQHDAAYLSNRGWVTGMVFGGEPAMRVTRPHCDACEAPHWELEVASPREWELWKMPKNDLDAEGELVGVFTTAPAAIMWLLINDAHRCNCNGPLAHA